METTASVGILGLIMSALMLYAGWYILTLIARWKVFDKAGVAGWKSLIPIYSDYCTYKIAWNTKYFWYFMATGLLSSVVSNRITAITENGGEASVILTLLSAVCSLTVLAISLMMNINLSKKFGHGLLFGLGLAVFAPIFTMILGLGSSEYCGNPEENLPSGRYAYR